MTPPAIFEPVGWHEVHDAHGARKNIRVRFDGRTFEGHVVEISREAFSIEVRGLRTTFFWRVDGVEVLDA